MKRKPVAIIGLGNILFQDEGTGLHATLLFEKQYPDVNIDIVHAGTPGLNLLHQFQEREKIIFIDAGYCEAQPGEFRRFTKDEVISRKHPGGYSLHQFDLISFLHNAEGMGFLDNLDVSIYCMQVAETNVSESLSKEVAASLPRLIEALYDEVNNYLQYKCSSSGGSAIHH